MKLLFRISLIFILLLIGTHMTLACTCVANSLGKRFREAKAVFIGRAAGNAPQDKSLIQIGSSDDTYSQTSEVIKGFKGIKKRFVSVSFDVEDLKNGGMCPILYQFEQNREYLVFAYGKNDEVQTVGSDTWAIPSDKESPGYARMQSYVKNLVAFGFANEQD